MDVCIRSVCVCVCSFNLSKVRNDGNAVSTLTGNVLLLISLACDGLTG